MEKTGKNTFFDRFKYALSGIRSTFLSESNFRIQGFIAGIVVVFGLILKLPKIEWLVILLCIAMVLCAELFNTALEHLADKINPKHDSLIGKAKDAAAGAVFLTAIISFIIGCIIFLPKILTYL